MEESKIQSIYHPSDKAPVAFFTLEQLHIISKGVAFLLDETRNNNEILKTLQKINRMIQETEDLEKEKNKQ